MQDGTEASRKWNRTWRQSPVGLQRGVQDPAVARSVVTGQVLTRGLWVSESGAGTPAHHAHSLACASESLDSLGVSVTVCSVNGGKWTMTLHSPWPLRTAWLHTLSPQQGRVAVAPTAPRGQQMSNCPGRRLQSRFLTNEGYAIICLKATPVCALFRW